MSGPAIHHIVAESFAEKLKVAASPDLRPMAEKLLAEHAPYFFLGSQGPDFLFFNTKDLNPGIQKFVKMYMDVVDFMESFKAQIKAIIPEELKDAVETLEDVWEDITARSSTLTEIETLLNESKDLISLLETTLVTAVEKYVTDNVEVFNLLEHPIQHGHPPSKWWWFDTLHYRRTGFYANALLKNSRQGSPEHAYALGYLSHFASDVVGHPFVNIIAGGPYRTHPKRHKLIENMQDTWAFQKEHPAKEFIQSKLSEKYQFGGQAITLPSGLNSLILNSIKEIYFKNGHSEYGLAMNSADINLAYEVWMKWFKATTDALPLPKPEPYSFTAEIAEVWENFVENAGDIFDWVGDSAGGGGFLGFLQLLGALILAPFLLAGAAIDAILGTITTIGVAPIRFFISLAYDFLYTSFMNFHQGVVLNGLAFPFNSELNHYLARHVLHSKLLDANHNNASSFASLYPTRKYVIPETERESHLVYPTLNNEPDICTGAIKTYYSADANHYMFGRIPLNQTRYDKLKDFVDQTGTQTEIQVNNNFLELMSIASQGSLGNAVMFGQFLLEEFLKGRMIGNFNLDADKGIGFQAWRKVASFSHLNDPAAHSVAVLPDETTLNTRTDIINPNNNIL